MICCTVTIVFEKKVRSMTTLSTFYETDLKYHYEFDHQETEVFVGDSQEILQEKTFEYLFKRFPANAVERIKKGVKSFWDNSGFLTTVYIAFPEPHLC